MMVYLRLITVVFDLISLFAAFAFSYFLRVGFIFSTDLAFTPYAKTAAVSGFLWILSLLLFRGYHPSIRLTRPDQLIKILFAGIIGTSAFGLLFYFWQKAVFSRLLLLLIFFFGCFSVLVVHALMRLLEKAMIQKGYGLKRLLIIGTNRGVKSFLETLQKFTSPYIPVAILDGYGTGKKEVSGIPVLGKLNLLEDSVKQYRIEGIVQGDNPEQVLNLLYYCKQHKISYYLLPYFFGMVHDHLKIKFLEKPVLMFEEDRRLLERLLG